MSVSKDMKSPTEQTFSAGQITLLVPLEGKFGIVLRLQESWTFSLRSQAGGFKPVLRYALAIANKKPMTGLQPDMQAVNLCQPFTGRPQEYLHWAELKMRFVKRETQNAGFVLENNARSNFSDSCQHGGAC